MTVVKHVGCLCLLLLSIVVVGARPARAQVPRASGPFEGLFGGVSQSRQTLDLRGSLFAAYQEVFLPEGSIERDPTLESTGAFHGASAGLSYGYNRGSAGSNFFFGGNGSVSRVSLAPDEYPFYVSANSAVSTRLTERVTFSASGDANYSPFFGFPSFESGFTPVGTPGVPQDPNLVGQPGFAGVLYEPTVTYGASAGIGASLSRQTTLSASADWRETVLLEDDRYDTRGYSVGARIQHQINRYVGVHAGYTRGASESDFPGAERVTSDSYDLGLDANYGDVIELGPRTTAGFDVSTGVYNSRGGTNFRLNGGGFISHQMGRTWAAQANYSRSAGYVLGFADIVLSDRASGSLSGLLFSRLSSTSTVTWERAEVGFDTGNHFNNYSATSGLTFGLTRFFGLYAQYSYFFYDAPAAGITLPFRDEYARQIISGGLTARLPILDTGRGTRDSR